MKFKIGDKVVPINKTQGCVLSNSLEWKAAQQMNQPFLYICYCDTNHLVCHRQKSAMSGDHFCEEDLIFYKEELEFCYGEVVLVRDYEKDYWQERIFLMKVPNNSFPFLCVNGSDIKQFESGYAFDTRCWKFCQKKPVKPQWEPVVVTLNHEYCAHVDENIVKVGCQEFSFDAIKKLYNEILKAEQFTKDNA